MGRPACAGPLRFSPDLSGEASRSKRVGLRLRENKSMGLGRVLILVGAILIAIGALLTLLPRLPLPLGKLPGDLTWRGKHWVVYFPLGTSLLLSLVLTLVLWLLARR